MIIPRLLVALAVALLLAAPAKAAVRLTPVEQSFLQEINAARASHGSGSVALDVNLITAARFHSDDMVRRGFFAHGPFAGRLRHFGMKDGYVGEDLGWTAKAGSAVPDLLAMWLKSPLHRHVLLNPRYRRIGIGVRRGRFEGYSNALVVTADFFGK
jgi:uncharacterized protein YkwD